MAEPGPEPQNVPAPNPPPPPADPAVPQVPQQPGQQLVHLNWSYFKPEFSGKPDKDREAHLLHTNDWMNAHHFIEGVKVQRLWYQSLEPSNVDWQGLQNLFRQQYSKIGNTRE